MEPPAEETVPESEALPVEEDTVSNGDTVPEEVIVEDPVEETPVNIENEAVPEVETEEAPAEEELPDEIMETVSETPAE